MVSTMKFKKVDWAKEKKKINKEEIDWEDNGDLIYEDRDERMTVYAAEGIGKDTGKKYQGSAEYCCGELIHITDIEEV